MRLFLNSLVFAVILFAVGCSTGDSPSVNSTPKADDRTAKLEIQKGSVVRFFQPMSVRKGDWLDTQKESGETFAEYVASGPTLPTAERRTIYIQPIGTFDGEQRRAIRLAAEFIRAFYNLPVKLNADRALEHVPKNSTRLVKYRNNRQVRTTYFLDDLLPKMLPKDAAALVAFTNADLFPSDTWAFVFGQASFEKRVGVWSLYRFADTTGGGRDPKLILDRTLKISAHEIGHLFSMKHCVKYECLMSGTNGLEETDRRPLDNCPECMAKVSWAVNYDPAERYANLASFWTRQGRMNEAARLRQMAAAVSSVK